MVFYRLYKLLAKEIKILNVSNVSKCSERPTSFKLRDAPYLDNAMREICEDEVDICSEIPSQDLFLGNKYIVELLMLFNELLNTAGQTIKGTIHRNYTADMGNQKIYSSLKRGGTAPKGQLFFDFESKSTGLGNSSRKELEAFCAVYNDANKVVRGKEATSVLGVSAIPTKLSIDSLVNMCREKGASMLKIQVTKSDNSPGKNWADPLEVMNGIYEIFQKNYEELRREIGVTLKASSLKHIKIVSKPLFFKCLMPLKGQTFELYLLQDATRKANDLKKELLRRIPSRHRVKAPIFYNINLF